VQLASDATSAHAGAVARVLADARAMRVQIAAHHLDTRGGVQVSQVLDSIRQD